MDEGLDFQNPSVMIGEARAIYESYNLDSKRPFGLVLSRTDFGGTHTPVTSTPFEVLGEITHEKVFSIFNNGKKELNLYIHIPFCMTKCGYCSYVSRPNPSPEEVERYLDALKMEIALYAPQVYNAKKEIVSIYIGGGTPAFLSAAQLGDLMDFIRQRFDIGRKKIGVCSESNPLILAGAEGEEKLDILIHYGLDRLNIGVQSSNHNLLKQVGRSYYTSEDVIKSVELAREKGIKTINLDFMLGLLDQKIEDVAKDLELIAKLKPESITWYDMRLSEHAWLRQLPDFEERLPLEKEVLTSRVLIIRTLEKLGYVTKDGHRFYLKNNVDAEDAFKKVRSGMHEDMLGLGASAYSHFFCQSGGKLELLSGMFPFAMLMPTKRQLETGVFTRNAPNVDAFSRNTSDINAYMEALERGQLPRIKGRIHAPMDIFVSDFIANLKSGDLAFTAREKKGLMWPSFVNYFVFGNKSDEYYTSVMSEILGYRKKIVRLIKTGYLEFAKNKDDGKTGWTLRFTEKGRLLSNEICRLLFSPAIDSEMVRQMKLAKPNQTGRAGRLTLKA
ncbi:Radical SAM superfamily protein [Candidatus Gugararchaeum adminiculabundum]|nr:Radical SAM superfamily protein [Candidatus Gugararchaeum adminiculabundum]